MSEDELDKVIFQNNWEATTRMYREADTLRAQIKTLRELITMQAITFEGCLYYLVSAPEYDDYLTKFEE